MNDEIVVNAETFQIIYFNRCMVMAAVSTREGVAQNIKMENL